MQNDDGTSTGEYYAYWVDVFLDGSLWTVLVEAVASRQDDNCGLKARVGRWTSQVGLHAEDAWPIALHFLRVSRANYADGQRPRPNDWRPELEPALEAGPFRGRLFANGANAPLLGRFGSLGRLPLVLPEPPAWWRDPNGHGDHPFPAGTGASGNAGDTPGRG